MILKINEKCLCSVIALPPQTPFQVNLLIAGFDKETEQCELYMMDYLAANVKVPYAAHGYGGFFTTAIMDRDYRKGMSKAMEP